MRKIEEVIDFLKSKEKLYSQMDDSDRKKYVMECLDTAIMALEYMYEDWEEFEAYCKRKENEEV